MISRREILKKSRLAALGAMFSGVLGAVFPEAGLASPGAGREPGVAAAGSTVYKLGPNTPGPGPNMVDPGDHLRPGKWRIRGL